MSTTSQVVPTGVDIFYHIHNGTPDFKHPDFDPIYDCYPKYVDLCVCVCGVVWCVLRCVCVCACVVCV